MSLLPVSIDFFMFISRWFLHCLWASLDLWQSQETIPKLVGCWQHSICGLLEDLLKILPFNLQRLFFPALPTNLLVFSWKEVRNSKIALPIVCKLDWVLCILQVESKLFIFLFYIECRFSIEDMTKVSEITESKTNNELFKLTSGFQELFSQRERKKKNK